MSFILHFSTINKNFFIILQFNVVGERIEHEMTVAPSLFDPLAQQTTTFLNLKKFTAYNVTVLCFTDPGDGPISSPSLVVTHEDGIY